MLCHVTHLPAITIKLRVFFDYAYASLLQKAEGGTRVSPDLRDMFFFLRLL
jgi:hypothetical protein